MIRRTRQDGFTLLEVLVAIAILAVVVMHFLATRTAALVDAADARNWRVAREIAEARLSKIKAGDHEIPPENRATIDLDEDYPGFSYRVFIGESAIAEAESEIADTMSGNDDGDDNAADRREWQRERDTLRRARSSGMSFTEYEDQLRAEELEEKLPSEREFEDVAVVVYFPNLRSDGRDDSDFSTFTLKAKISTMALQGLTPEQAEVVVAARGGSTDSGSGGGNSGGPIPGGGGR